MRINPRSVTPSGAVDYIELLVVEFCIEYGREYRIAILLLHGEVVGHGVAGFYAAAAVDHSTLVDHGLCECGFPRSL